MPEPSISSTVTVKFSAFDRYGVDGVMPPSDSDSDDDAPSSSGTVRDQGANSQNDNNFANDMRDRIMFEMYLNYN